MGFQLLWVKSVVYTDHQITTRSPGISLVNWLILSEISQMLVCGNKESNTYVMSNVAVTEWVVWHCDTETLWHYVLWHCDTVTLWHCDTMYCDIVTLWHCVLWPCKLYCISKCNFISTGGRRGENLKRDERLQITLASPASPVQPSSALKQTCWSPSFSN